MADKQKIKVFFGPQGGSLQRALEEILKHRLLADDFEVVGDIREADVFISDRELPASWRLVIGQMAKVELSGEEIADALADVLKGPVNYNSGLAQPAKPKT